MEEQRLFFEILKTRIPEQFGLVDVVEEALQIRTDSVYRRIRGEKELSFSELHTLCKTFNISMDEIFNYQSGQSAMFRYSPVNLTDQESYIKYVNTLLETLTAFKSVPEKELCYTGVDIPFYHFLDLPELMFLKLYAWNDTLTHTPLSYEGFCNQLDSDRIIPVYRQLADAWQHIPSKEIWTDQTIDATLRLLEHYYETGAFEKRETFLLLVDQLKKLMNAIKKCADDGYKGVNTQTPFYLYLCSVDIGNNIMLIKKGERQSCTIRLYTVNSIVTENKSLCHEMDKWINDLILKSILISGTSYKDRYRFFRSSMNKIDGLLKKFEMSDNT